MINTADTINAWIKANDVSPTDYQVARLQDAVRELVKQWVAEEEEAMMGEEMSEQNINLDLGVIPASFAVPGSVSLPEDAMTTPQTFEEWDRENHPPRLYTVLERLKSGERREAWDAGQAALLAAAGEVKHCPCCNGVRFDSKSSSVWVPCPGVVCPECAEKDAEIARLTAQVEAAKALVAALDRCESNRGRFSTAPMHDCRCTRKAAMGGGCTCGGDELEAARERFLAAGGE